MFRKVNMRSETTEFSLQPGQWSTALSCSATKGCPLSQKEPRLDVNSISTGTSSEQEGSISELLLEYAPMSCHHGVSRLPSAFRFLKNKVLQCN